MRLKHELRHLVQRFGIDIVRYPLHDPMARVVQLLNHHRVDCVVDVGANDGGYATTIRGLGYTDRIISMMIGVAFSRGEVSIRTTSSIGSAVPR